MAAPVKSVGKIFYKKRGKWGDTSIVFGMGQEGREEGQRAEEEFLSLAFALAFWRTGAQGEHQKGERRGAEAGEIGVPALASDCGGRAPNRSEQPLGLIGGAQAWV